ncbi:hypothetical protein [Tropicimonas sp. S265A]|uniref:hypothetical protein n=1 Tax=Tropicimonas sp. S265A TaxID=3415134 RepID=UPI003C7B111B
MSHLLLAAALVLGIAGPGFAQNHRAEFQHIRMQEQTDPRGAFDAMQALARAGYPAALARVGYYFRHGIGTNANLEQARTWYTRSVAAGHPWSAAALARVEMALDRGDRAFRLLQTAVRQNRPGAERLLATAHVDRKLGAASDPATGQLMLERLAASGDIRAAYDLAARSNWGRLNGPVPDTALAQVVRAGLEGDARFAEVALVYLSRHGDKSAATLATRARLANIPGMRPTVRSVERIRLAAEAEPAKFWTRVEEIMAETEVDGYARAARTAFWINKNAWVRVLQKDLRRLGYYDGTVNGLMTARTIRAQNRFCRDTGIGDICSAGPLRGPTVRAVAEAIAQRGRSR